MHLPAEPRIEPLDRLKALLEAILPGNRFYRAKIEGVSATTLADLETYARLVPFTTKSELVEDQERYPPYGSNLTFPRDAYTRCHQTSGTAGAPLRWLDTPQDWQALLDQWKTVYLKAGVTATDRLFFAF